MKPLKLVTIFLLVFLTTSLLKVKNSQSVGTLTSVKDIVTSSQLSYFARMGTGVTANDNLVKILLGSSNPSNTTNNLFIGDTVAIGTTGSDTSLRTYTVTDIGNTAYFTVGIGLSTINSYTNVAIISTRSAIHTITFTPVVNVTGGKFEFLIKASSRSGENYKDGIPDQQGFDFGQSYSGVTTGAGTSLTAADVACPLSATASVGTTVVISNNSYISVICSLGTGITNQSIGYSMVVGRSFSTGSQLSNPSPGLNHIEGSTVNGSTDTDVYSFYIRHLDNTGNTVIEATQGKIAVIEAVRVTATVDPTLTFTIDVGGTVAQGAGTTLCSAPLSSPTSNTTATSVSFGSLSLNTIAHLGQHLSVITNAASYAVTAYADKPMTITSGLGTTIPNTSCDAGTCTYTSQAGWTGSGTGGTTAKYGFGYSLDAGTTSSGTSIAFSSGGANTVNSKPFGIGSANAATIFSSNTTPTVTDNAYVCYRINVGTAQLAGNYESKIIYTATSTF